VWPAHCTILADDLTGACDASAPFARTGRDPLVLLDCGKSGQDVHVVAYDLDLRDRPPGQTYAGARLAAGRCVRAGDGVFAKIDSTLRGAVVPFVTAIRDGTNTPLAVIAPAFPAQGRGLVNGRLRLDAGHAGEPAVNLLDWLAREGHACLHVPVAAGVSSAAVAAAIRDAQDRRIPFVVVDGTDDAHLAAVAAALRESTAPVIAAGSGGLAAALAKSAGMDVAVHATALEGSGPVLVFAGSPAPASRVQVTDLAVRSQVRLVHLPCESIDTGDEAVVVFAVTPAAETGPVTRDQGQASALLAQCAARLAARFRPRALVLIGGASARAVCLQLGAHGMSLRGEAVRGVPWGVLCGGPWDGVPVLTKSGGFGTPSIVSRAVQWCQSGVECT
jgi:uncharacterized protein YgbK (DUF1537 family)